MIKQASNGRKWWFLGTLITLAAMVFGAGVSWGLFQQDVSANAIRNAEQDTRLLAHDVDIRDLGTTQARIDERLKSIDARQIRMENQQLQIISLLQDSQ